MNKISTDIKLAPQKAVENSDQRLKGFFDDCDDSKTELIYEELSSTETRYVNFEEIASGGMKTIYAVDDVHGDRKLAMALLHEGSEAKSIEPFLREARLTARLDHPNIIKIHDIGLNEEKKPFFTMDLKNGNNLAGFIKQDCSLHEALVIFLKICDAISYAHSKGVIHLDLKPENIQIGEYGEVLVCDWGLGKVVDDDKFSDDYSSGSHILNNATLHGHIKGTPGFMAPEQICGEDKTPLTDIFSLGAILYNILTKKKPYRGSVETILKKTVDSPPTEPSKISPDLKIPVSLEAVVMRAMATDSSERYRKVKALSKEVRAYLSGFATEAEKAGILKSLTLLIKRNKAAFTAVLFAGLVIVVSTGVFISQIQKEKKLAIQQRDRANSLSIAEQEAREKAEEARELLAVEKAELKELNERYVEDLTLQSIFVSENLNHWDVYDEKIYIKTLENLDKATAIAQKNHLAWAHKTILLFIMQRYEESLNAFKKSENISFMWPVLQKAIELNIEKSVSVDGLSILIALINRAQIERQKRKALIDKLISYDLNVNTRNTDEKLVLTRALIKVWNPVWKGTATFNAKAREMVLSGPNLSTLRTTQNNRTIKHNLLRILNPVSVKLIDTSLKDLFHLSDMALQELDIRGTKIKTLRSLNEFKQLSTLVVRPKQLKKGALKGKPDWVKIIEKD